MKRTRNCCRLLLQLYVDKKVLEEGREGSFADLKNLVDTGDIVGVTGE